MSKTSTHVISIIQLVYRRLRRFLLAVLLIIIIENLWSGMQQISSQDFQRHSEELMLVSIQQAAFSAKRAIVQQQPEVLSEITAQLTQHPLISHAIIRDHYGVVLATTATQATDTTDAIVIAENIMDEDSSMGFIEVEIDRQALLAAPDKTYQFLTYYGQFLLFFAVLAGIFATTTFNRWRYRKSA